MQQWTERIALLRLTCANLPFHTRERAVQCRAVVVRLWRIGCSDTDSLSMDPALQETWVSQAAAQQRRGRAGRVRPGVCFRLFSRATWESLQVHSTPVVLSCDIDHHHCHGEWVMSARQHTMHRPIVGWQQLNELYAHVWALSPYKVPTSHLPHSAARCQGRLIVKK